MKRFVNAFFFFLENLGAGVWVGALATFGFAVAAPVFRGLPSVTLAGTLTAQVLHRINLMEMICASFLVLAALVFLAQREQRSRLRIAKTVVAGLMVAGRAKDLKQAVALAQKSIDSGEAEGRLQRLIATSNA